MITTNNNSVYSALTFDPQPETQLHLIALSPDGNQIFISDLADRRVRVFTVLRGNTYTHGHRRAGAAGSRPMAPLPGY